MDNPSRTPRQLLTCDRGAETAPHVLHGAICLSGYCGGVQANREALAPRGTGVHARHQKVLRPVWYDEVGLAFEGLIIIFHGKGFRFGP